MRPFCYELEKGSRRSEIQKYRKRVENLAKWHKETVNKYSDLLKLEASMSAMKAMAGELAKADEILDLSGDFSYNYGAKLNYFNVAEAMLKLILSCFSYGPSKEFFQEHGFNDKYFKNIAELKKDCMTSWLDEGVKYNTYQMTEIVAKVLRDSEGKIGFDLVALQIERNERNALTHAAETSKCLSAMRCYNAIRSMLIYLDPKYEDELIEFRYNVPFSFDEFLAPCDFNFEDYTTILIIDSVHDVREDYRKAISNLPWDLVLDFDGYSGFGGLLSTVTHNQIKTSILSTESAKGIVLNRGETEWYICGQYQQYDFIPRTKGNPIDIPAYIPFVNKELIKGQDSEYREACDEYEIRDILRFALKAALKCDRSMNIVVVTDDYNILSQTIQTLHNERIRDFFLTWIGITANGVAPRSILDKREYEEKFAHFCCAASQFFMGFMDRQFLFKPRTNNESSFSLMTEEGLVPIDPITRHNLSLYFEPLYDGCELVDPEDQETVCNDFYHGNVVAPWFVIANQYAVQIKRIDEYKPILDEIGGFLGKRQDPQKRLVFINHKPGIGGTTFARQIAWDLHNSYAVLYVKHYEQNKITGIVEKLYDNVLNTSPIVLVADDTLSSIRSLCEDVMRIERRCMLIVSCRDNNSILSSYKEAKKYPLQSLTKASVEQLRSKYQSISKLPASILKLRNAQFTDKRGYVYSIHHWSLLLRGRV